MLLIELCDRWHCRVHLAIVAANPAAVLSQSGILTGNSTTGTLPAKLLLLRRQKVSAQDGQSKDRHGVMIRQRSRQCWALPVHQPGPGLGSSNAVTNGLYRI